MAKFLSATDGSRQTNEQTKPWYDEFIHQCNAEIDTEEGCLALASGIHFLQVIIKNTCILCTALYNTIQTELVLIYIHFATLIANGS